MSNSSSGQPNLGHVPMTVFLEFIQINREASRCLHVALNLGRCIKHCSHTIFKSNFVLQVFLCGSHILDNVVPHLCKETLIILGSNNIPVKDSVILLFSVFILLVSLQKSFKRTYIRDLSEK